MIDEKVPDAITADGKALYTIRCADCDKVLDQLERPVWAVCADCAREHRLKGES